MHLEDVTSMLSTSTFSTPYHENMPTPPPLQQGSDRQELECPYCFLLCQFKTWSHGAWEKHIFRGLRPHICTYQNCNSPMQLYGRFKDWARHETLHQPESTSSQGQEEHCPATRTCPFCHAQNVDAMHVACHLQRVALFVLPRSAGHDRGHDTIDGVSEGVVKGSSQGFKAHAPRAASPISTMSAHRPEPWVTNDIIRLMHGKRTYELNFPAVSIKNGTLRVAQLRERVADVMQAPSLNRVELVFKQKTAGQ